MANTKTTGKRVVARRGSAAKPASAKPAAKATAKPAAPKKAGANARTGAIAKINANVKAIAKKLAAGATMRSMKEEYGVTDDGPIRSALYRAGFDSKGSPHGETEGSINTGTAAGKKKVVKLRADEGAAWYRLSFLTGLSESEVKALVAEAGGPTGRVYVKGEKEATASAR